MYMYTHVKVIYTYLKVNIYIDNYHIYLPLKIVMFLPLFNVIFKKYNDWG